MIIFKSSLLKIYSNYRKKYFNNLSEKENRKLIGYIYIIFTLFTVSFFGIFAIGPTLSTISTLRKQYEENKKVYESLRKKLDALTKLDALYNQIQSDLPLINAAIPPSPKVAYLTRQIEILASSNGLAIDRLEYRKTEVFPGKKTGSPIFSFYFDLILRGNEKNINTFISEFIQFERIISIESIITGSAQNNAHQASFTGKAFYFSN